VYAASYNDKDLSMNSAELAVLVKTKDGWQYIVGALVFAQQLSSFNINKSLSISNEKDLLIYK
jgi:hypothetical protein